MIRTRELVMRKDAQDARTDPKLLELLVCPLSKGTLTVDRERCELVSTPAKLAFPIRDGIPIMLPSEARVVEDDPGSGKANLPPSD
jgi:uncharacterized protein